MARYLGPKCKLSRREGTDLFLKSGIKLPVYANKITKKYLLSSFEYCFKNTNLYPATLMIRNLKKKHVFKDGKKLIHLKAIPVQHGPIESTCYIINNKCAYASDISKIYNSIKTLNILTWCT